jgi:hypothetical protein
MAASVLTQISTFPKKNIKLIKSTIATGVRFRTSVRITPARMYMDGVDFMPTSRNVLFGYHFKGIAAAGSIVGPQICGGGLPRWLG